jgi:hypothetical protein
LQEAQLWWQVFKKTLRFLTPRRFDGSKLRIERVAEEEE